MNCPKCGNELVTMMTTQYMAKGKQTVSIQEPWAICSKAINDLLNQAKENVCRYAVME